MLAPRRKAEKVEVSDKEMVADEEKIQEKNRFVNETASFRKE